MLEYEKWFILYVRDGQNFNQNPNSRGFLHVNKVVHMVRILQKDLATSSFVSHLYYYIEKP